MFINLVTAQLMSDYKDMKIKTKHFQVRFFSKHNFD